MKRELNSIRFRGFRLMWHTCRPDVLSRSAAIGLRTFVAVSFRHLFRSMRTIIRSAILRARFTKIRKSIRRQPRRRSTDENTDSCLGDPDLSWPRLQQIQRARAGIE